MRTTEIGVALLILWPLAAALSCYLVRSARLRRNLVYLTGAVLTTAALLLSSRIPFSLELESSAEKVVDVLTLSADLLLLGVILLIGLRHRHRLISILAILQLVLFGFNEVNPLPIPRVTPVIHCDALSLLLVLIVSVVGSVICIQALAYMPAHEAHLRLPASGQHRFFAVMLLFLAAMNGLVLADRLAHLYFFFELTTICSYLLIAHDATPAAENNALRALWINCLGGLALVAAVLWFARYHGIIGFRQFNADTLRSGAWLLPLALMCLAGFTKAAQFPFQSWLLGAMVAPTPVSALLHSSTMVKAGVYLVLRIAPFFQDTSLGLCLALFGAFGFLAAAALALGQRNGKRVLAYSTISNLGLMFACAGFGTPTALTAAVVLLLFHAVTKALLFLCVGAIEQRIDSRDIEDMRGLYTRMPLTALITVAGVIFMIMPPFGLLIGKWMALEAAARNLAALVMLALGSALTVMYWARWAGTLMSDPFDGRFHPENQPMLTWGALGFLSLGVVALSVTVPWLYGVLLQAAAGEVPAFSVHNGTMENPAGVFSAFPLCIVAGFGFLLALWSVRHARQARVVSPYLSGAQQPEPGVFTGPMNQPVKSEAGNYYFAFLFGEERLTGWINAGALLLLTLLIGGTLR
ncbi:MAG: proton-conducting transporter membrane subunit [Desulfobacterales bacterium]